MAESRNFVCEWTDALCTNGACKIEFCATFARLEFRPTPEPVGEARKVAPLGRSRLSLDVRLHRMKKKVAEGLVSAWARQTGKPLARERRYALGGKLMEHPKVVLEAVRRVRNECVWTASDLNRMTELAREAAQEVENKSK